MPSCAAYLPRPAAGAGGGGCWRSTAPQLLKRNCLGNFEVKAKHSTWRSTAPKRFTAFQLGVSIPHRPQVLEEGPAPASVGDRARAMLMGDGRSRWFDKTIQVCACLADLRLSQPPVRQDHPGVPAGRRAGLCCSVRACVRDSEAACLPCVAWQARIASIQACVRACTTRRRRGRVVTGGS